MIRRYNSLIFIICALIFGGVFLYAFNDITFPFITGMVFAYSLAPLVDKLQSRFSRITVSAFITLTFVLFFIFLLIAITPRIERELSDMINRMPYYSTTIIGSINTILQTFDLPQMDISNVQNLFINNVDVIIHLVLKIFSHGNAITGFFSCLVVIPVTMFYLMRDWNKFVHAIFSSIPLRYRSTVADLSVRVRTCLGRFLRGQVCVSIILAFYYSTFLFALSLPKAIVMGTITGFMSFVPFVGAVLCGITSFGIGIFCNFSITKLIIIAVVYTLGPLLESYVLTPRFVGGEVGLHPLWILFAFFAGIQIYGIIGAAVAIPCAAVVGEVSRFFICKLRKSMFFKI